MIAIFVAWITILCILFTFGDIFTVIYNKLCRSKESYGVLDTVLLGMCFVLILLSFTSLWLPSNEYILFAYIIIGIVYWLINRKRLNLHLLNLKNALNSITIGQKLLLILSVVIVVIYVSFTSNYYDSDYYHHQHIRWNEEYPIVPGLANLEDRFGFNSNYLLLSAIFTFRFAFGEAVYLTQSLIYVLILCWAMMGLFRSRYNIKYIILLLLTLFILSSNGILLSETSTDVIPFLCVFYYLAKTVLQPQWYKKQPLLACLLPVTLITFKISSALFCLISLAILIYLLKKKESRKIAFIMVSSFLVVSLWCTRNVIICGYLVYPLYQIDLFSFDWKVPEVVLALQRLHIYEWAKFNFDVEFIYGLFGKGVNNEIANYANKAGGFILLIFAMISPIILILNWVKRKKVNKTLYYTYFVAMVCLAFGMLSAPDPRFVDGYIFGIVFITLVIILSSVKLSKARITGYGIAATLLILLCMLGITLKRNDVVAKFFNFEEVDNRYKKLMCVPWRPPYHANFTEYPMGNYSIYLTDDFLYRPFDFIPATNLEGIPFIYTGHKLQSIETIEARGSRIEDGFRTKRMYIDILNNDIDKYIKDYYTVHLKKYPAGYIEWKNK